MKSASEIVQSYLMRGHLSPNWMVQMVREAQQEGAKLVLDKVGVPLVWYPPGWKLEAMDWQRERQRIHADTFKELDDILAK